VFCWNTMGDKALNKIDMEKVLESNAELFEGDE
jgi:hypothetical protein